MKACNRVLPSQLVAGGCAWSIRLTCSERSPGAPSRHLFVSNQLYFCDLREMAKLAPKEYVLYWCPFLLICYYQGWAQSFRLHVLFAKSHSVIHLTIRGITVILRGTNTDFSVRHTFIDSMLSLVKWWVYSFTICGRNELLFAIPFTNTWNVFDTFRLAS